MTKKIVTLLLILIAFKSQAQFQYSQIIGKNSSDFTSGYGGYLKFNYPLEKGNIVSLEGGATIFQYKKDTKYGWVVVPIKAGYMHTLNKKGYGVYVEPQVGYNVYGITVEDKIYKGFVAGIGTGYLFDDDGGFMSYDLGLRYETSFYPGGTLHYVSIRFTKAFSLGKRK